MKGPKWSPPTVLKAVEASNRSSGRSAITGAIFCSLPFLQLTHLFLIDLKEFRMSSMHIFCWTIFLTCSMPSCWLSLCSFRKNNSTAWCFQCSKIRCFALKSSWLLPILPLARISSSLSRNSENCRILLPFGISSLHQTVFAVVTWRLLLLPFLFLQYWLSVLLVCVCSMLTVRMPLCWLVC